MKRNIIEINEDLCDGCGQCVTGCAEGALAIIDGKARLIKEQYCDGLGACLGECPTGALQVIEREAEEFDERLVQEHLERAGRPQPVAPPGGCPGSRMRFERSREVSAAPAAVADETFPEVVRQELNQWPVMLHLVSPAVPYFKGRELVVLSTCSPVACPDVQWRFIRGRPVVVACPKFDRTELYREKLAALLRENQTPCVYIVRMEVPCCGGLTALVQDAARMAGGATVLKEVTVSLEGRISQIRQLA